MGQNSDIFPFFNGSASHLRAVEGIGPYMLY